MFVLVVVCMIFLVKRSLFADTFINCCLIRRELNITKMPRCLSIDYLKLVSKYSEVFVVLALGYHIVRVEKRTLFRMLISRQK